MQSTLKVCKLYLLICFVLSVNTTPILNGIKTTASDYQQSGSSSSFHHESSFFQPDYKNVEIKSNVQAFPVDQHLKNTPGVTTTFRDQNGNLVTQVKKEVFNNENGQSSRAFEFKEDKQLPNGYSKSFKTEYSSSSLIEPQPNTYIQNPLNVDKYYNSEQLHGASSAFKQHLQNNPGFTVYGNSNYAGINSNLKSTVDQSISNVPQTTSTFRDQYGNLVTQVKKEVTNNDNGQTSHVFEIEETKQLPNGYAKSFKKEYSSSSVTGSQPTVTVQNPMHIDKYFNSEQLHGASSTLGQSVKNYQVPTISSNTDYVGTQSNSKLSVGQSFSNVPEVTSTFRDQYGNLVTQIKKEATNNDNGQKSHVFEFEETKQLPNGYAKSFKKEYSSSSITGSQPTVTVQNPTNVEKYYNSEQLHGASSTLGQSVQNYQVPMTSSNTDYVGTQSNSKFSVDQSLSNVPGATSTFRDKYGNLVTQVKKEVTNNDNGQKSHVFEFEETKQLPNGYAKSFKKEYSSSSVINSNPTLVKDTTESILLPQKLIYGETEKLNGYNTFFNNQKYPINLNVPITSYVIGNKKPTEAPIKANQFGSNTKDQIDCDDSDSTSFNQGLTQQGVIVPKPTTTTLGNQYDKTATFSTQTQVGQQSVDLHEYSKPSSIGQIFVNDYQSKEKIPTGQQFEKIELFSSQTQVGQQSVDLHDFSKPSSIGQTPVNTNYQAKEKIPTGQQFEKIESFSSQTQVGQQSVDLHDFSKPSSIGQTPVNTNYQAKEKIPTGQQFEKIESFSSQTQVGQQSVDLHDFSKPTPIGQSSVNIDYLSKPKNPTGQQFESFSSQTQVGQQSVDLHDFSKPSSIGQIPVNNNYQAKEKIPTGQQFEKIESFSSQTQVGQQSVDLHDFSKPSSIGQTPVNTNYQAKEKIPTGQQFEKIESFSSQTQVGQQSVDLHDFSKPSSIGQTPVNTNYQAKEKIPTGQQFEKIESFSSQTQVGQQSVDLHDFSKPTPIGQSSVNIDYLSKPKNPTGQQFESFSSQTQVGQQSVDLHDFSKPSSIGQIPVNNNYQAKEKIPTGQQFEKIESFSSQTQVGQQSVDLHDFTKPTPIGQASVNIDYLSKPKNPTGQQFEKIESFSSQTQVGQQSVDLHDFTKPSPIGQASVNIDYLSKPKNPTGQQFEKIESFSSQTQVGQQSVDFHDFSKPTPIGQAPIDSDYQFKEKLPTGQHFGKIPTSYQNKYNSVGQLLNNNQNGKPSLQHSSSQQNVYQPITGQQIQGLEFLTSNFGETTHALDLGVLEQKTTKDSGFGQQNVNNGIFLNSKKPVGQQTVIYEKHNTFEKDFDVSSSDQLPTNVNNYQGNANVNHQTLHSQSIKNPAFQGQQTVDFTSDFEKHTPTNKNNKNVGFQKSEFSSHTGKLIVDSNNQPTTSMYNSVFDKLGQLEHEIIGGKSTVSINKDNSQTSYATNHNVKSMPIQTQQENLYFSKSTNENTQYIEPESEIVSQTNGEIYSSNSFKNEMKSVIQQDGVESYTLNTEHFSEQPTTQSSVWKKIGDKFKGTIQNAKTKAQQIASNINDKVGF